MIFTKRNGLENIFTIKMHWKCFYDKKEITFHNKNPIEMSFTIKCIRNDFYYKNALEMIFTIKKNLK